MSNRRKYRIATIIAILLFIIFLWYYFKNRNKKETCPDGSVVPADGICKGSATNSPSNNENGCIKPTTYITNAFPLSLGMKGNLVKEMQISLNTNYSAGIAEDGVFGCKTLAAVKKYFKLDSLDAEAFNNLVQPDKILPPNPLT